MVKTIFCLYLTQQINRSQQTLKTKCHAYLTISPRRTRRLLRTQRLMRILSSETVSSDKTMQTVSFRRLPFIKTVSPRNSCSSSILFCNSVSYTTAVKLGKVGWWRHRRGQSFPWAPCPVIRIWGVTPVNLKNIDLCKSVQIGHFGDEIHKMYIVHLNFELRSWKINLMTLG